MPEVRYSRPRHAIVARVLDHLDAPFLEGAQCFFGGGTRVALSLNEYRESADIDFLCSSREGYRELRAAIDRRSLGKIAARPIQLAREVVADRYGIRTFVEVDGEKIKFEIVNEARIDLSGDTERNISVRCLDRTCCFAEKFLANDDRWSDESVQGRDIIDLAFMAEGWGSKPLAAGARLARAAYGDSVERSARAAAKKLIEKTDYFKRCVDGLRVKDVATLRAGLKTLAANRSIFSPSVKKI